MKTWIISMKVHRGPHVDWKSDQNCLFPSSNNIHLHFAKALGATKCTSVTLIHGTCSGQKHVSSYDTSKGLTRACVCSCLAHSWSYLEKTFPWTHLRCSLDPRVNYRGADRSLAYGGDWSRLRPHPHQRAKSSGVEPCQPSPSWPRNTQKGINDSYFQPVDRGVIWWVVLLTNAKVCS